MKILYLAHRIPYPPNKGDKIRSFHEIECLSAQHEIDLICLADNPGDMKYKETLERYCANVHVTPVNPIASRMKGILNICRGRPISVGYFYSKNVQRIVDRWLSERAYDAILCFSSPMAEYIFRSVISNTRWNACQGLPASSHGPVLIMDFCDVDSDKWNQYASESSFPMNFVYSAEGRLLLQYEEKINRLFDASVFVSQKEAELFRTLSPDARNIRIVLNGVDHEYFSPQASGTEPIRSNMQGPVLVFIGALDYHANIDGLSWFCREIFPFIRRDVPGCRFHIVGSNPTGRVMNLAREDSIAVTGNVDDIRPYYRMADLCVVPLRLARGVQNKILEAMSMERPVVTTTKPAEGIAAVPGKHLVVENSPQGFADAVVSLLRDHQRRMEIGTQARNFILQCYNWSSNMARLDAILQGSGPNS